MKMSSLPPPVLGCDHGALEGRVDRLRPAIAVVKSNAMEVIAGNRPSPEFPTIDFTLDPNKVIGKPLPQLIGAVTWHALAGRMVGGPLASQWEVDVYWAALHVASMPHNDRVERPAAMTVPRPDAAHDAPRSAPTRC